MVTGKKPNRNLDGISRKDSRAKTEVPDDFYSDVDKKSQSFSFFWIGIVVVLIIIFSLVISLGLTVKRNFSSNKKLSEESSLNLLSFADRMNDIRGDGHKVLTFSREEFAVALGVEDEGFPLDNAKFDFTDKKLRLTGRMKDSLVFWPIGINISHAVLDGKYKFLVAPDSFENIIVSSETKRKIEEIFETNLNEVLIKNQAKAEEIQFNNDRIELHLIKEN